MINPRLTNIASVAMTQSKLSSAAAAPMPASTGAIALGRVRGRAPSIHCATVAMRAFWRTRPRPVDREPDCGDQQAGGASPICTYAAETYLPEFSRSHWSLPSTTSPVTAHSIRTCACRAAADPLVGDDSPAVVRQAEAVPERAVGQVDARRVGHGAAELVLAAVVSVLVGRLGFRRALRQVLPHLPVGVPVVVLGVPRAD